MNREEILAMEAGEKLNKLIAEQVMNYRVELRRGFYDCETGDFCELPDVKPEQYALCILTDEWLSANGKKVQQWDELPKYSEDISAAPSPSTALLIYSA